ncbi:hypothetical protein [Bacillus sp. JCM 19041]|uniref:hypothetical protein n=1 Tax=Bacillus sp. JCM 19041 TaxID=1460637 RepID=UPI0006D09F5A
MNSKQIELLKQLHERDYSDGGAAVTISTLGYEGMDSIKEAASDIDKLERRGLVSVSDKAYITGGQRNNEYGNNVIMIWFEEISILTAGIEQLKLSNT